MLELRNITKRFNAGTVDETTVFDGFDFKVEDGDFVSVIGSNGSGKTTLLNLICGSLHPDEGKIIFNDRDITNVSEYKRAKIIGRVFQDPKMGTCPDLTILENMALADNKNKPFGLGRCVNKKRIEYYRSLLEQCDMGLENRLGVQVGTLSGGQRQALALVIANMTDLDMLILDEHIAALDPKSSERVMELTDRLVKKHKITTLMVTHNLRFAVEYGNRLVMMHEGNTVVDIRGAEKEKAQVEDLLAVFDRISIEKGN
ncbi:MAG TPA: ATP-binding cassette domain-containing protein [Candidatus Eubacterium faecale]|uniref:ATP-binding cassette domain-containing protein n=1 Tax=Candidatus Eubacterium faecale TaxID=2838568 RepID=A0A9D2MIF6_9FIRM|nr:ATP-binding cassette domain-containing protein [Candidatus Eubacterium faecale]